jgi:hypothetical protein
MPAAPTTTAKAQAAPASSPSTSTRAPPLLVVGSINQDVVLKVERLPAPGETLAASSMEMFPGGKVRRELLLFLSSSGRVPFFFYLPLLPPT